MPKTEKIVPEKLIGSKVPVYRTSCSEYDALRYALGIGFSMGNPATLYRSFKIIRLQIH